MSLDDVVAVNLVKGTSVPTRLGFGTMLLLAYHTVFPDLLREYKSVAAMTADGFPTYHPAVKMATKAFSQNPKPKSVIIGRRATGTTQVFEIVPKNTTKGFHYQFTVKDYLGVETDIDYAVGTGASVASVIAGILALMGSIDSVTSAAVGAPATKITLTSTTAGRLFSLSGLPGISDMTVKDTSTDPGVATELSAIEVLDAVSWYGIALDSNSKAEILAAAAWTEARRKLLLVNSTDSEIADNAVTDDVFSSLKTAAYARTHALFSQTETLSYSAVAEGGSRLPITPGKTVWVYNTLAGVVADNLTESQQGVIRGKNGSTYTTLSNLNIVQGGKTSAGEWVDVIHGTDKLHARLQERIFGTEVNLSNSGSKIPYTDKGVVVYTSGVTAELEQAIKDGFLADTPKYTVTAEKVANVDPTDRANRVFPPIEFSAPLAGAILAGSINGTLTV